MHGSIVALAEIAGEEEVAVLLVVGHIHFKRRHLRTTSRRNALGGRVLLRKNRLQLQLTKLHVRTNTKQTAGAFHQRVVRGEGDVTRLHQFDNLIFLALIAQLDILGVEVESGVGVVVQVHVHLVTYLTIDVQVDFLVEVDGLGPSVSLWQRGVIDVLEVGSQLQLRRTLRLDAHTAGAEYLLGRSQVEVHIREVELVLALGSHVLRILLAEETPQLSFLAPCAVFLGSHQHRSIQVVVAYLRTDDIHSRRVIILHLLPDILREVEVDGRAIKISHLDRCRLLNPPAWFVLRHRFILCLVILRSHGQCAHAQQDCYDIGKPLQKDIT